MENLLSNYTVSEIILCCVLLAAAIKGIVGFLDWAWARIRKVTDADYKTKAERKALEEQVKSLEKFYAEKEQSDKRQAEMNSQILDKLTAIENTLNEHIQVDDKRNADSIREYILHFNMECVRELKHTREDFIEVLSKIDEYEEYCDTHEHYENNRAVSAVKNVKRVYDERLLKGDFL